MTTLGRARAQKSRGPLAPFVLLMAISLALLLLRNTDVVKAVASGGTAALVPVQRVLAETGAVTDRIVASITEIERLRGDNARLRVENDRLVLENVRIREDAVAARAAAALGSLAATVPYETVTADVIARDPGVVRTLVIGSGTDQGVAVGHVVLAEQGLVGRITEVGPAYAKVLLVTDPSSVISALVQNSRASGIVRGQFGESLLMEWVLASEPVKEGDVVLTAGLGLGTQIRSHFPKGLVMGQVVQVDKAEASAYLRAVVLPAVDVRKLEHVLVVKTR